MDFSKYIAKSRIIDIKSPDFEGATKEMLAAIPHALFKKPYSLDTIFNDIVTRERNIATYLGNGILMPHTKAQIKQSFVFVIGRCINGLSFENRSEYKETKLVFMLLSSGHARNYLNVLGSLAKTFTHDGVVAELLKSNDFNTFKDKIWNIFKKSADADNSKLSVVPSLNKSTKSFLNQAKRIAKISKASCIMFFGDVFPNGIDTEGIFDDFKTIIATEHSPDLFLGKKASIMTVRSYSNRRMSQLGSAILMAITKGLFRSNDKICCIGGIKDSSLIDTIAVIDVGKEFSKIINLQSQLLPSGVKPEVVERMLAIAIELSVEGREGKPVGCLFVIGDSKKILPQTKQLVLNPFYGYKPEDRNILSPFMDETIKELSMLDGAIVVDGSGSIESAGTLIHTPDFNLNLPGGLGARHAAAYSISLSVDCLAFVVSSSTGTISIFRKGQRLLLNEKSEA